MKVTPTLVFLLWAIPFLTQSQIIKITPQHDTLYQYQRSDYTLYWQGKPEQPYDPEKFSVDLEAITPSGKKFVLPCFYNKQMHENESQWEARLAPSEPGQWNIEFVVREKGQITHRKQAGDPIVIPTEKKGFLRPYSHWAFQYDNGTLFRGVGENIGWESRDTDDSKYFKSLHENPRFHYEEMLKKLAANGGNFFRTWMIYWNLPVDWPQVENNSRYQSTKLQFNTSGMERLDKLVEFCDSLQIHMMLALESHVGYMGTGWETNKYNIRNGGFASTPNEFFSLKESRKQYKQKLRLMVARYGYSPSIAAWEFFNEIDNIIHHFNPPIDESTVTDWHREMADYLRAIDPYQHLITTSISHREVPGLNNIQNIQFNQKHIYCRTSEMPDAIHQGIEQHNKPYVIGEFGYDWDWSKNFNLEATRFDRDFKAGLWLGLFSPTPILPMSWWWEFFDERGMMSYFKNVQWLNLQLLKESEGNLKSIPVFSENKAVIALGLSTGENKYIYLYNPTEMVQSTVLSGLDSINKWSEAKLLNPDDIQETPHPTTNKVAKYQSDSWNIAPMNHVILRYKTDKIVL